jgi:hypothetical protein
VENNYYSVPDYLVGNKLTVKSYISEVVIFSGQEYVCSHTKAEGAGHMKVDIMHYLSTLIRKPGALKNSKALRSQEMLKKVFDDSYDKRPREFIEFLIKNKERPLDEIAYLACQAANGKPVLDSLATSLMADNVKTNTRLQLKELSSTFLKGAERRAS